MKKTYLGFDTWADALTFKKFIISIGYTGIGISKDGNLFKVYFNKPE